MKAGREMDALMAEKVLGRAMGKRDTHSWEPFISDDVNAAKCCSHCCLLWFEENPEPDRECNAYVGNYSSDIAAAWEVVEKMRSEGFDFTVNHEEASFDRGEHGSQEYQWGFHFYDGDKVPLAICLAALQAVGVEMPV